MYGGGNIGRGFIGALMSGAGYEVTFIDVAEPVVRELQERRRYPLRFVSNQGNEDVWVEHVTAVNGNDAEAASASSLSPTSWKACASAGPGAERPSTSSSAKTSTTPTRSSRG